MEELEKKVNLMEMRIIELERENGQLREQISSSKSVMNSSSSSSSLGAAAPTCSNSTRPAGERRVDQVSDLEASLTFPKVTIKSEPVEQNLDVVILSTDQLVQSNNNDDDASLINLEPQPLESPKVSGSLAITATTTTTTTTTPTTTTNMTTNQALQQQQNDAACLSDFVTNDQLIVTDQVINVPQRKDSTVSNGQQQPQTDDDYFIDDILMSQERQEEQQLVNGSGPNDEVDLVANLVGVVCEPGDDISVVKSICDQINREDGNQQLQPQPQQHQIVRSSSSFSSFSSASSCSLSSSPLSASSTTSSQSAKDVVLSASSPSSNVSEATNERCNMANGIKADYQLGISDTTELVISK